MLRTEPPSFGDMSAAEQADEMEVAGALFDECASGDPRWALAAAFHRRVAAEIRADAGLPIPV